MPVGMDCGTFNLVAARRGEGDEVKSKQFPAPEHTYPMPAEEFEAFAKAAKDL